LLLNCNIVDRFSPPVLIDWRILYRFLCVCVCALICFLIHSFPLCLSYHCLLGYLIQVHTFEKRKKMLFKKCFLLLQSKFCMMKFQGHTCRVLSVVITNGECQKSQMFV
jgi:hypothetical protein